MSNIEATAKSAKSAQSAQSAEKISNDINKIDCKSEADFITVHSTLPLLSLAPGEKDRVLETERLFLRPLVADDLESLHTVRTRQAVMVETRRGTPDRDLDDTREYLALVLPLAGTGHRTMVYAICLKEAAEGASEGGAGGAARCGELIGFAGVFTLASKGTGWPELGYMLHDAHWGKGYMTEFVRGYMTLYAALPRPTTPMPLRVNRTFLTPEDLAADTDSDGLLVVEEKVTAIVAEHNAGSRAVVRKTGFTEVTAFKEDDGVAVRLYQLHPGRLAAAGTAA